MQTLIVGDPMDKNTDIGAINSKEQLDKINDYLKIGVEEGAEMWQSGCAILKMDIIVDQLFFFMFRNHIGLFKKKYLDLCLRYKHLELLMKL